MQRRGTTATLPYYLDTVLYCTVLYIGRVPRYVCPTSPCDVAVIIADGTGVEVRGFASFAMARPSRRTLLSPGQREPMRSHLGIASTWQKIVGESYRDC
jgi:hypothetical protein